MQLAREEFPLCAFWHEEQDAGGRKVLCVETVRNEEGWHKAMQFALSRKQAGEKTHLSCAVLL
eukprot:CAMPEP_0196743596 /NCGR_PEP_ID=MMETSP1091-20130531/53525_1 /TAXON_ID=302021 /ORGANISM="Rhodomonas sp., Strain CCMP768" /LENGTH=62 /DNA_ID=CAMNT_0042089983 /DNA_START=48 /DNA_END=233 /DNA_ORIENTATION=-